MNAAVAARIARLPVDPDRNLPIPWFVHRTAGEPIDFRIADANKRALAIQKNLCWCCGEPLGKWKAYLAGPMCIVTRASAEPPMHRDCAASALQICPFLSRPAMKRSPRPFKSDDARSAPGKALDRNPGVTALAITDTPTRVFNAPGGFLISLPTDWAMLQFWREGRLATRDEIFDSLLGGLPELEESAAAEGAPAIAELRQRMTDTTALIDRHLKALEVA